MHQQPADVKLIPADRHPQPQSLPTIIHTPRQSGAVGFPSPRKLGDPVDDRRTTAVQRRIRLLEDKVVTTHVNAIAAWPSTATKAVHAVTTRPPLSVELENYVRKELKDIVQSKPGYTKLDTLPVFREVFGTVINHFPEYASVLSLIKCEYDGTVDELQAVAQRAARIELENKSMKGTHAMQLLQEREQMQACLSESGAQLQSALRANQQQRVHIAQLEHELAREQRAQQSLRKEYEAAQERVRILSLSLVEEAHKMAKHIADGHKAQREIERLESLVASLQLIVSEGERIIQAFRLAPVPTGDGAEPRRDDGHHGPVFETIRTRTSFRRQSGSSSFSSGSPQLPFPRQQPASLVDGVPLVDEEVDSGHFPVPTPPQKSKRRSSSISGGAAVPLLAKEGGARQQHHAAEEVGRLSEHVFDLECKIEALEHFKAQQANELKKLQWKYGRLQKELSRDTLTPRPDWGAAARRLRGFQADPSRSTDEKVGDLITHINERLRTELLANERKAFGEAIWNWMNDDDVTESDLLHRYKFFVPRGTDPSIPIYLRSARPVRNRRLKKPDVEVILTQFWNSRIARRRTIPFPSVEEYWLEWAVKQSGSCDAAVELSYNVLDVCERFQQDPDCKTFLKVLRGDLCELIVADQKDSIESLQSWCSQYREASNDVLISRHNFFKAVRIVYPGKSRDSMDKLRFVLSMWNGAERFDYRDLFVEDGDKSQSKFVEMLRKQHIEEVELFTIEVLESIRALTNESGQFCIADAILAVANLDPAMTDSEVQQLFSTACRLTLSDLLNADRSTTSDAAQALQRFRYHILLKRRGPPPQEDEEASDDEGH